MVKKLNKQYYFSVEGQTEKWYLDWLQSEINKYEPSEYKVNIISKQEKDPASFVKSITKPGKEPITHLCDCEGNSPEDCEVFKAVLDKMKKAGKKYCLGYSNYTFELWIILHKKDCNKHFTDRNHYLGEINDVFNTKYKSLDDYKKEENFKRCLQTLSLRDVRTAVDRANKIMETLKRNGGQPVTYKGYEYYMENPSTSVWQSIRQILVDCKIFDILATK